MAVNPLECPVCFSLFEGSIFQCKNGHAVCDACRVRIHGTCPYCREPVGDIRCRALEDVIAGMALPCSFRSHGCMQLLEHTERRDHEAFLCQHAPFVCPFQRCSYSGLLLYDHIQDAHTLFIDYVVSFSGSSWRVWLHQSKPFVVLLDPVDRSVFLLLNGGDVRSGQSLSVVCLGRCPVANQVQEYKLEVGGAGQPGALLLTASGSIPCMRSWAGQHPTDGFLFVPGAYRTSSNSVVVNVHVYKSTINNASRSPQSMSTVRLSTWSSLTTPCISLDWSEVDTYWSSLVRWLRHPSLETFNPLLVLPVFVFSTMAVMLALAWRTGK